MNYLVIDPAGLYVELANGLADKGKNKVFYWTEWSAEMKFEHYAPGLGFEYLEKVLHLADYYERCQVIVNFDVTKNDEIAFLRKIYGNKKSIFGSGHAAKLEFDRWQLKKVLRDVGLKVNHAEKIKGVSNLREYLKSNKNKYVKINIWRGNLESFYAPNYESVELIIDDMAVSLGMFQEDFDFICEDFIDAPVEIGFDGFFNGKDYLKPSIIGIEYKKSTYVARVSDTMPIHLEETLTALKPVFSKLGYRGAISTEELCIDKKKHFFLDLCARSLNPVCVLYPQYILNWPSVVEKVGRGEDIRLNIKNKYLFAQPLNSNYNLSHHVKVDVDKKDRDNIKLVMAAQYKGNYFSIKGTDKSAVLIAASDTIDEGLNMIKKYADRVNVYGLEKEIVSGIEHIKGKINAARSLGIDF